MKLNPKPIVNAYILVHCIGIDPSCLFYQLLALGITSDCMLAGINWRSHQHLTLKIFDLSTIELNEVQRGVKNGICGVSEPL
jgi:hypothetical protein